MLVLNEPNLITANQWIGTGNLFSEIEKSFPNLPNSERLNNLFRLRYGDKWVINDVAINSLSTIADLIVFEFGKKWEILLTEIWVGFNLGTRQATKLTETINRTENRTTSKDDLNKVTSYENETMINDTGINSTGNDDLIGTETKTTVNEIIDMETAFNNLSLTIQNSIIESVLNDVQNFITLGVY